MYDSDTNPMDNRSEAANAHLPKMTDNPPSDRFRHVSTDLRSYLREARRDAILTADDERELGWKMINDQCPISRDTLARANFRLVVAIVRRYAGRGASLADLVENGNAGLLRAVESFDPAQGIRFSTHAGWWIKQAIRQVFLTPQACAQDVFSPINRCHTSSA